MSLNSIEPNDNGNNRTNRKPDPDRFCVALGIIALRRKKGRLSGEPLDAFFIFHLINPLVYCGR